MKGHHTTHGTHIGHGVHHEDEVIGKHDAGLTGHRHAAGLDANIEKDTYYHSKGTMGDKLKHGAAAVGEKIKEKGYDLKSKVGSNESKLADKEKAQAHGEAFQDHKMAAKGQDFRGHAEGTY